MIRLYNSKTRKKEQLNTVIPGEVRIYVCGPTVYDYFHVGNARAFMMFDTLRRYLEHKGLNVIYVQNLTDIDDKMIDRARREGVSVKDLGDRFIAEYFHDADSLGIKRANFHPRATEHIPEIIGIIETLIKKGYAYQGGDGVYFDTHAYEGYGALSSQNLEDLEAGARVEVDESKRNPADFALWKSHKEGEPFWESPWGNGRPGWHIECSAMSMKYLGETIDIHCGGQDLLFPHHENEAAQSEAATGKPLAKVWLHNGYINIDGDKMSKSKGTFFTIRDIAKEFDLEAVRMFLLSAHYRSPVSFSRVLIEQAKAALERLYNAKKDYEFIVESGSDSEPSIAQAEYMAKIGDYKSRFDEAMDDDLNTAGAIGVIFDMVYGANVALKDSPNKRCAAAALDAFASLTGILGLLSKDENDIPAEVTKLVNERQEARKSKNWAAADSARDRLRELGYTVEDTPQGPKVKRG